MVKTNDKIKVCRKYRLYLEVIFIIGNCVMLQKQFYEICRKLNISISDYQIRKALDELERSQIIKKQKFLYSKNNLIVLKKFGIRFLLNKDYSSQVSSLPKNIDKRAIYSVFKSDRIIKMIDGYELYSWENFLDKMYDLNSSILYNKYKGIFYHEMLIRKYNLNISNQELYFKCYESYNRMLENLEKGRNGKFNHINKGDELDIDYNNLWMKDINNIKLKNLTMNTLINSNVHIQSINDLMETKIVEVLIMDVNNTQNTKQIIDNIIATCIVLCNIFNGENIEFRFRLLVWDDIAKYNIKGKLGKIEPNQGRNYIRNKLSLYKIDGRNILLDLGLDVDDIKISIKSIDFYRKYLENRKNYNY